jgi:cysteine desulfurase/selenocysteine lyase
MSNSTDIAKLRADFPILSREVYGRPLVYLDNAASAQKPQAVIDAMTRAYAETYANVHRGVHYLSTESTAAFEKARETARRFFNAKRVEEIIFTKGGTEAINLVASGLGAELQPGDEILLTEMEHHSNIVPWNFLRERQGVVLRFVPILEDGALDMAALRQMFSARTKIVALTHMSNVLGTINPLPEIIHMARGLGAKVLVDGCQGAVHAPVDVQALDCDFYVATGHKLYGPTGIGILYGRYDLLKRMRPYQGGGEMIRIVTKDAITYADPPHRFEAGTPPIVEAIGLGAALDYLGALDRKALAAHEESLLQHATEELSRLNRVRIFGRAPGKGAILTFEIEGAHAHDVSTILDRTGVAVRGGHHCAQILMERLGVTATARASFAFYNTHDEVEALIGGVREVLEFFK